MKNLLHALQEGRFVELPETNKEKALNYLANLIEAMPDLTPGTDVAGAVLARDPYAQHFADWRPPWNYAGPAVTRERLRAAGFSTAECWLEPAPREPEDPRAFLSTIVLGPHMQQLPEHLREPFMDDVLAALGEPVVVDYVRLNIDAVA